MISALFSCLLAREPPFGCFGTLSLLTRPQPLGVGRRRVVGGVYSLDYVAEEKRARRAGLRFWSGSFEMPWDWRQKRQHR
jgi:hypothetical protein